MESKKPKFLKEERLYIIIYVVLLISYDARNKVKQ